MPACSITLRAQKPHLIILISQAIALFFGNNMHNFSFWGVAFPCPYSYVLRICPFVNSKGLKWNKCNVLSLHTNLCSKIIGKLKETTFIIF